MLASCLPKSDQIELIVQKCTELGISEMVLVQSERTVARVDKRQAEEAGAVAPDRHRGGGAVRQDRECRV